MRNDIGADAIVGIILMVAIVVAIGGTVYFYVTSIEPYLKKVLEPYGTDCDVVYYSGVLKGYTRAIHQGEYTMVIGNSSFTLSKRMEMELLLPHFGSNVTVGICNDDRIVSMFIEG
jgi:FlaG/FlaF family flagellin (archaellin)